MKRVAVIIVNYNGQKYLPELFESLQITNYQAENWQVVLVDNVSTDESVEFVKKNYPNTKILLQDRNTGFAEGNNIGADWALKNGFDYIYNSYV